MKKLLAFLLCASMLFALSVPAMQTKEEGISVCGGVIFDDEDDDYDNKFGNASHA